MTVGELKLNLSVVSCQWSVVTERYLIKILAKGEGIPPSFDGAMQV